MLDKQPHNISAHLIGTGEFAFAEGATSAAAAQLIGYQDFGNITAFDLKTEIAKVEHKGSYRGIRRIDRTGVKDTKLGYQIKCDEVSAQNARINLYGSLGANYTQVVRTAAAADAIASPIIGRWYDLLIGGVRVRKLTVVSCSAGVEDTDYVVDYELGRIRSLTATGFGTATLTAPAITVTSANTMKTVTPLATTVRRGMARLTVWNDDGSLAIDHEDFYCELFPEGNPGLVGEKETELSFEVNVLSPVGTIRFAQ